MMRTSSDSKKRVEISYEETRFSALLKLDGYSAFKNWSLFWAIILSSLIIAFIFLKGSKADFYQLSNLLSGSFIGASAGALGIIIAALTMAIALFQQELLPLLLEKKILQKFLFPFWFAVAIWAISLIMSVFLPILYTLKQVRLTVPFFAIEIFLFLYATFYTVNLTGWVVRFALQKAQTSGK